MSGKPITLLLIESNPEVIAAVHTAIRASASQQFVLHQADRLEDGLEYLGGHVCDAVLACLALPDIQGLTTVKRLAAAAPGAPIIVLSHDNDDSAAVSAVQAGAQDFVIFREIDHALLSAIRHAMERAALLKELREARDQLELRVEERTRELRQKIEEVDAARERMRVLSQRLVEVQETERRYLARELHDEVGQLLTGLKLRLAMARRLPQEEAAGLIDESLAGLNELMTRVREMSLNLRPAVLDDLGLLAALQWHFDRFMAHTGIKIDFRHEGLKGIRFSPPIETAAFRIVQEAMTNIARHAQAAAARVDVLVDPEKLQVRIADNGCGFDLDAALAARASNGLTGMSERALLAGGCLTIESKRNGGTILLAAFPLYEPGTRQIDKP